MNASRHPKPAWQPITDAKRDTQPRLVRDAEGNQFVAWWQDDLGWVYALFGDGGYLAVEDPTMWHPLPPPA